MLGIRPTLSSCALLAALLTAAPARAKPSWQTVRIPILPPEASLGEVWAGFSGDLFLWARTRGGPSGDVPTAHLLHWNGERWSEDLTLPGQEPADVFGTDERNVFATTNKCEEGRAAGYGTDRGGRLFRSTDQGATWIPQALPAEAEGLSLGSLGGGNNNIQVVADGRSLLRFDGVAWSFVFKGSDEAAGRGLAASFEGTNEGYLVACNGWGRWIDGAWKFMPAEFGFCAARGLWGLRDRQGNLQLYAADDGRFSNGLRVWKFNPPSEDFDVVLEEASEDDWGGVNGLWGPTEDDIYVVGRIGDGDKAGSGRVYHFDGRTWKRDVSMGPIPAPLGIHGTSRNDVWLTLADGRLLHYSTAVSLTRRMAGLSTDR